MSLSIPHTNNVQQGLLTEGRRGAYSHDACADGDWRRVHCYLPAMLSTRSTSVRHFRLPMRLGLSICRLLRSEQGASFVMSALFSTSLAKTHATFLYALFVTFSQSDKVNRNKLHWMLLNKCSVNCIIQHNTSLQIKKHQK